MEADSSHEKQELPLSLVIVWPLANRFKVPTGEEKVTQGPPITLIVRHPNERPSRCSVYPLRGRPDLRFLDYPPSELPDLAGYVRLAPEGPPLSAADGDRGLLLLDGSWRWATVMTKMFAFVPARSLCGYQTAYPRVSKLYVDPPEGLATVEALFLAHHILGRPTTGLLDHYRWRERFLQLNGMG
jgi:pre-rRNA-processing protein TSR3